MLRHLFCEKCSSQFGKKYVFDHHLSLVHGEKIEVTNEPQISKETFQVHQRNQEDFLDPGSIKCFKCNACDSIFKSEESLKRNVEN